MTNVVIGTLLMVAAVTVAAQASKPDEELKVVPKVDLQRYMGTWYEAARLPNSFQTKCVGDITATYTLLDDGTIEVVNRCRKGDGSYSEAKGRAKQADDDGPNTKLKVRFAPAFLSFLPFVWGDYWIIDLAPDYSYAVIGEPDRKYLWVLSRTPSIDQVKLGQILEGVKKQGYDITKLIQTTNTGS